MESLSSPNPCLLKEETVHGKEACSECSCDSCRNMDSGEDCAEHLDLRFTKIKERHTVIAPVVEEEPLLAFQAFSSHSNEHPTVAIEDLNVKQARLQCKKQRHCSFCRIHGFSVNIKGHKTFCQFREKCTCKGCTLIRCNQQVSRNQVRLRRNKHLEREGAYLDTGTMEQHETDNIKKTPMCFKCWVHDSVRVRLKGHRNICPYMRCACSNCTLNADRKWLTRELRQFVSTEDDRMNKVLGRESVPSGVDNTHLSFASQGILPTDHQHNVSALMNAAAMMAAQQNNENGIGVVPDRQHKEFPSTVFSSLESRQKPGYTQSMLNGSPYDERPFQMNSHIYQDANSLLSNSTWQSKMSTITGSSHYVRSRSQEGMCHVITHSSSCHDKATAGSCRGHDNDQSRWLPHQSNIGNSDTAVGGMHSNAFVNNPFYHTYPEANGQSQFRVISMDQL